MSIFCTLARRELAALFLSVTGYVIIAAVTLLVGLSFVVLLTNLGTDPQSAPVTEIFYGTFCFWLIILVAGPVITMRLFALEKSSGTFETLMTTPVKDIEVVLAKFTAALVFYTVMWLPLLGCMLVVRHYTNDASILDAGVVGSTFLGVLLLGAAFAALGCFASALTRNQAVAAMISLVFGVSLFLLAFLADRFTDGSNWQTQLLACFTLFDQMHDFARGVVDTRPVLLYASLSLFFLFLTLRVVESRRWK